MEAAQNFISSKEEWLDAEILNFQSILQVLTDNMHA